MSEVFQDVNPLDYVMAEEDDPECPKDIEIPYDDAEAVSGKTQDGELMHNVKCSSSLFFGKRALQVRLPNFKFKAKHLDQDGRFSVGKLRLSHPSFFVSHPSFFAKHKNAKSVRMVSRMKNH